MRYLQDDWNQELGGAFRAHAVRPKTATRQARELCANFVAICCPNLGGQQMLVRMIDLENMFPVDVWPLFFTNCSAAFCLFGQG